MRQVNGTPAIGHRRRPPEVARRPGTASPHTKGNRDDGENSPGAAVRAMTGASRTRRRHLRACLRHTCEGSEESVMVRRGVPDIAPNNATRQMPPALAPPPRHPASDVPPEPPRAAKARRAFADGQVLTRQ